MMYYENKRDIESYDLCYDDGIYTNCNCYYCPYRENGMCNNSNTSDDDDE